MRPTLCYPAHPATMRPTLCYPAQPATMRPRTKPVDKISSLSGVTATSTTPPRYNPQCHYTQSMNNPPCPTPSTLKHIVSIGDIFGRFTVLAPPVSVKGIAKVHVKCACGTEKQVHKSSLVSGASSSCGCYRVDARKARTHTINSGAIYGSYTVQSRYQDPNHNHLRYTCICACGASKVLRRQELLALPSCSHKAKPTPTKQASWCSML